MAAPLESPAEEVARLRSRLNDLVNITTLPALSTGGEPLRIVSILLDALVGMLRFSFACVRLNDPEGGPSIEMMRVAEPLEESTCAREIGEALEVSLSGAPLDLPPNAQVSIGDIEFSIASTALGLQGEFGVLVAGSRKDEFPGQTAVLLDVAADRATIALQQARLLSEQKRASRELDERVGQQTRDLATANEELKKSERESRLIIDSIPGLVALLTAAGDVDVVNRQVCEYFGQTLEELRQWGTSGAVHPEDLPHVAGVFTQAIGSGSPYEIVQRFRRADGVYRWFQNRGFPLRDADGHIVRWCVLLTDIDDRKSAEDAVHASQRNLSLIINLIPTYIHVLRTDGSVLYVNQAVLDYTGATMEDVQKEDYRARFFHPEDVERLREERRKALTRAAPFENEQRVLSKEGKYRWFLIRHNPLLDEQGRIDRWYVASFDIEDRKRAEAQVEQAYLRLAEAQRLSKTGSFITDLVADDHNWSEETFRIFEFDPAARVTVQMIRDMVHPEDRPGFDAMIARAMTGTEVDFVFRIVTSRGALKHIRGMARILAQIEGHPLFIGALQDVTESKVAEEALDRARTELAHVARVTTLNALTASIAHEINQPLSGILTNASTCLRMLDGDPPNVDGARETARRTIRDGNRASDVITRLRALYSKKEFTLEPLDLNEATREVIALSLSDLQRNRVILRSELADDLPRVTGDRVQLQQVILNLLRNASDAMSTVDDRPRELLIRTERDEGYQVLLTVKDAGFGFTPEAAARLFQAFYTTKNDGMGIGLSVSRSIIERHHGRLWAKPNDGPGATFSFSIPCGPERATSAAPH